MASPSFSKLVTSLTGFGFGYFRDSRSASHAFGQQGTTLDRNQPRFGFEYFVKVNLNDGVEGSWGALMTGTGAPFGLSKLTSAISSAVDSAVSAVLPDPVEKFLGVGSSAVSAGPQWKDIFPLIKSIEMPSARVDTDVLQEYNRKRITQTKVNFEPIKMVIHDTVDAKAMKFWQTYYEYYFKDGRVEDPTSRIQGTGINGPAPVKWQDAHGFDVLQSSNGEGARYMINSIEIFQVHATKFNKVTLVNPRISAFQHDTLAYDKNDITELTFTFDYEYAVYDRGRDKISDTDLELTEFSEFMDLPSLAISSAVTELLGAANPLSRSSNPIVARVGKNVQSAASQVVGKAVSKTTKKASASVLDGMANVSPTPSRPTPSPPASVRPFLPTSGGG